MKEKPFVIASWAKVHKKVLSVNVFTKKHM